MRKRAVGFITFFCIMAMAASIMAGCGSGKKAPEIKSIVPITDVAGSKVTITGENFGETQGANNGAVDFAGKTAGIESWSDTSVTFIVPASADPGEYEVMIKTDAGESRPTYFGVKEAEKTGEPKTEEPKTELQVIEIYMKDHNIADEGVAGKLQIMLYKTSDSDPTWNLYQMPMGQGVDVTYFLVHEIDGKWEVVATWMGEGSAAEHGGPADLTTPAEEG